MGNVLNMKDFKGTGTVREWTIDEMIYIIYHVGGVVQLGKEESFVDHYWTDSIEKGHLNVTREEVTAKLVEANQIWLEIFENYYANGITIADVFESEASKHGMTVDELLRPLYDKVSLH